MAFYKTSIEDGPGIEIYNHYVAYCNKNGKAIPDPYIFWKILVEEIKYPISRSGFTHWLNRLQIPRRYGEQPYIWRDPETKAWCLRDVIVQKSP